MFADEQQTIEPGRNTWKDLKDCFHLTEEQLEEYPNWKTYPFYIWFIQKEKNHLCSVIQFPVLTACGQDHAAPLSYAQVREFTLALTDEQLNQPLLVRWEGDAYAAHDTGYNGEFAVVSVNL